MTDDRYPFSVWPPRPPYVPPGLIEWMNNKEPRFYWQGPDDHWYVAAGWRPLYSETCGRDQVPKDIPICIVHSPAHYLAVLDEWRME